MVKLVNKKTILITGASGFIGRNLRVFFERKDNQYKVFAPTHKELDLLDEKSVANFLKNKDIEIIIHSANTNTYMNETTTDYNVLYDNIRMFINLAKCINMRQKMIYFGSGAEYSKELCCPFVQEIQIGSAIPSDSYGFAKFIMAELTEKYTNVIDLCLFGVYGYYEEEDRRFISNIIKQALSGNTVIMNQHCYFDYLWIGDLCRIVEKVMHADMQHGRYNVCTGKHMDLYDIAQLILKKLKNRKLVDITMEIVVEKEGWKREYSGCPNRLLSEIGEFTFIEFEDSINRMIDFLLKQRDGIVGDSIGELLL